MLTKQNFLLLSFFFLANSFNQVFAVESSDLVGCFVTLKYNNTTVNYKQNKSFIYKGMSGLYSYSDHTNISSINLNLFKQRHFTNPYWDEWNIFEIFDRGIWTNIDPSLSTYRFDGFVSSKYNKKILFNYHSFLKVEKLSDKKFQLNLSYKYTSPIGNDSWKAEFIIQRIDDSLCDL